MDVKAELQYLLVIDLLERMARDGLLKPRELTCAKRLAKDKYSNCVGNAVDIGMLLW